MKSKAAAIVTTAIVVSVVFTLILVVVLSPSLSPLASVRDADSDGYADSVDDFPDDASEWNDLDGDGTGDYADEFDDDANETTDSDSDGVGDNSDQFPSDSSEWSDGDADGVGDNSDEFPDDPDEYCDSDSDGIGDNSDEFPDDSDEWADTDGDGVGDNADAFPEDSEKDSPEVTLSWDTDITGVALVFTAVSPGFAWDDLKVTVSNGSDSAEWEPEGEDLDGWAPFTTHVYEIFDIEGTEMFLIATDLSGDGAISVFDAFGVYPTDIFEAGVTYTLIATYEPTGSVISHGSFTFVEDTPVTYLTDTAIADGVKIVFGPVSEDVDWDQLSFLLSDGTNSGGWGNLTADMLDDGLGDTQTMQTVMIGTLVVSFVVQDLAGNGKVDQGDNIKLTASSFSAAAIYTFTVIYEPTGGSMAECTFSG
jgi:hypothetical protein